MILCLANLLLITYVTTARVRVSVKLAVLANRPTVI